MYKYVNVFRGKLTHVEQSLFFCGLLRQLISLREVSLSGTKQTGRKVRVARPSTAEDSHTQKLRSIDINLGQGVRDMTVSISIHAHNNTLYL